MGDGEGRGPARGRDRRDPGPGRGAASRRRAGNRAEDERFGADRCGDELPAELARRERRLERIRAAKAALEAEAAERERVRREELAEQGRRPRRPPGGRDPFAPKPRDQRNFTDPESKLMKTADGSFHQCFNGQAVVDAQAQVIVACELSARAPDAEELEPCLEQLEENLEQTGAELAANATLLADAGYFSERNVEAATERGLDPHIAPGKLEHREQPPPAPRGPIPRSATPRQRMVRRLRTKKGRSAYARRKTIVEPVFGQLDTVQSARRLLLRGERAARAQWRFNCAVHNLLKLHRAGGLGLALAG